MLSVVICTRNRIGALKQCLLFMIESARHFLRDWELIIVDNGSSSEISQEISTIAEVQLLLLAELKKRVILMVGRVLITRI